MIQHTNTKKCKHKYMYIGHYLHAGKAGHFLKILKPPHHLDFDTNTMKEEPLPSVPNQKNAFSCLVPCVCSLIALIISI